jgi:hypothetical protein
MGTAEKVRSEPDEDDERLKRALEALEEENRSLKELVVQLSRMVIRNVTDKKTKR